jgi:hypothetical protein
VDGGGGGSLLYSIFYRVLNITVFILWTELSTDVVHVDVTEVVPYPKVSRMKAAPKVLHR